MRSIMLCIAITLVTVFRPGDLRAVSPDRVQGKSDFFFGFRDDDSRPGEIHTYSNNLITSLEVKASGEMELNDSDTDILHMAAGAHLLIKERNWFTYREVEVTANDAGVIQKSFFVQGRPYAMDEAAQKWLARILPDVVHETGLGARARVLSLIAKSGIPSAIRAIRRVESSRAKQEYAEIILEQPGVTSEDLQAVVRTLSDEISSGSRLSGLLRSLADRFPEDSTVTNALVDATREISSSRGHSETLRAIAAKRRLDDASAVAMASSIEAIASSSAQADALEAMIACCSTNESVLSAYLHAVSGIASHAAQERCLLALLRRKELGGRTWRQILGVVEEISASSAQANILTAFAAACPNEDDILMEYLRTAGTISSSGQQERAVLAMLEKGGLSKAVLQQTLRLAEEDVSNRSSRAAIRARVEEILTKP